MTLEIWNLLPGTGSVNAKKRDRIPLPDFIHTRSGPIVSYRDSMSGVYPRRFSREINLALIGSPEKLHGWPDAALERLGEKCAYLTRGPGVRCMEPLASALFCFVPLMWILSPGVNSAMPAGTVTRSAGGTCS